MRAVTAAVLIGCLLSVGACAATGGAGTAPRRATREYVVPLSRMIAPATEALRAMRMEIVQAEPERTDTYLLTGRLVDAATRAQARGNNEVFHLEVVLEQVGPGQTRVQARPAGGVNYGSTQGRRYTEEFFRLLEAQGLTPLG